MLSLCTIAKQMSFPCGSASKESSFNAGDLGSIPGLGRYPGEGKVYTLQYFWVWFWRFPDGSDSKESAYSMGDLGLIPGLGRFLGEGNGKPLQYSCLENPMDTRTWQAIVHGVTKSWIWLGDFNLYYNLKFGGVMPLALGSVGILTV